MGRWVFFQVRSSTEQMPGEDWPYRKCIEVPVKDRGTESREVRHLWKESGRKVWVGRAAYFWEGLAQADGGSVPRHSCLLGHSHVGPEGPDSGTHTMFSQWSGAAGRKHGLHMNTGVDPVGWQQEASGQLCSPHRRLCWRRSEWHNSPVTTDVPWVLELTLYC